MPPAIFLDRDGVIIENSPTYIRSWKDVIILPGALTALASIHDRPYRVVMVTNQSVVGRGIIPLRAAVDINQRLAKIIEQAGGRIDGIFMCPHAPEDECDCRKPKPGLLLQAAQALCIDLSQSFMIGDALSDLLAGQAAGVRESILVRTGRGASQETLPRPAGLRPFRAYSTLADALKEISQIEFC